MRDFTTGWRRAFHAGIIADIRLSTTQIINENMKIAGANIMSGVSLTLTELSIVPVSGAPMLANMNVASVDSINHVSARPAAPPMTVRNRFSHST